MGDSRGSVSQMELTGLTKLERGTLATTIFQCPSSSQEEGNHL